MNSSLTFSECQIEEVYEMLVNQSQSDKIQILRGMCIIAVVLIHTTSGLTAGIIRPFLCFAVALFIFLSGLLTPIDIQNYKNFFKKRIKRVLIPYLFWSIVYTILYNLNSSPIFLIKKIIINIFTTKACGPYYFIFVYICLVLATPVLVKLIKSKYRNTGFIISIISVFIFIYISTFLNGHLSRWLELYPFTNWISYYYLGLCIGNNLIKDIKIKNSAILLIISIILQWLEEIVSYKFFGERMALSQLKYSSILTNIILFFNIYQFIISDKIKAAAKPLKILGDYSFGIYLCHILFAQLLILFHVEKYLFVFPVSVFVISFMLCVLLNRILKSDIIRIIGIK